MTAYLSNPEAWQESWDRQQESYLPDREHRLGTMLDAVAAAAGPEAAPRVLDLAGGTGSISLRVLARFPGATVTVVDQDPVLLAIAEASLRAEIESGRATVVSADLAQPEWRRQWQPEERAQGQAQPEERAQGPAQPEERAQGPSQPAGRAGAEPFDAVLTATALHWLEAERVAALYREIGELLRPGGIFVNADQMPDEGLPEFSKRLQAREDAARDARYAAGAVLSWRGWWAHVRTQEFFGPALAARDRIYPGDSHSAEWLPPVGWHVEALRGAGFAESGVLWRGGIDAAVVGVR